MGDDREVIACILHMLLFPKSPKLPPSIPKVARGAPGETLDPTEGVFIDSQASSWIGLSGISSLCESAQCTKAIYVTQSPEKWVETY